MRKVVGFLLLMWASVGLAQAPDISVGAGIDASRRNLQAEQEIRKRYEAFAVAFNKHDATAMAALWTRQGDTIEPDGTAAEGREAVEELFKEEHAGAFKAASITLKIDLVWMITPNVALVNGTYAVSGVRDGEGKEISLPRKGLLTSVMLNEDGQWWVAASRTVIPIPLPWRKPPPQP